MSPSCGYIMLALLISLVYALTDDQRLIKGSDGSFHRAQRAYLPFENACFYYGTQGCHIGAVDVKSAFVNGDSILAVERRALLKFYDALDGENWANNFGWSDREDGWPCFLGWYGVQCNENGRVVSLDLQDNKLAGVIPSALGELVEVRRINLSSSPPVYDEANARANRIQGRFPDLQAISHLEYVELSGNQITSLPYIHLHRSTLKTLSYTDGELRDLPQVLSSMPSLEIIDLARNHIAAELPSIFGRDMANVRFLSLASNSLTGEISRSIKYMEKMEIFDISNNIGIVKYWPKGVIWEKSEFISIHKTSLTSQLQEGDHDIPSGLPRLCLDVPFCYKFMWDTHPDFTLAMADDYAKNTLVQDTLALALESAG
eukprot:GEMP01025373.1.p1 GENE.GEMP01025373.1~~GEMP01025373.1.p1  ORF type:complete len:374 (+),score=68.12 GEMP01025373.1:63-1184(+)